MNRKTRVVTVVLTVAGMAAAFVLGRQLRSARAHEARLDPPAAAAAGEEGAAVSESGAESRAGRRDFTPPAVARPAPLAAPPTSRPQAARSVRALLARVAERESPGAVPEAAAAMSRAFLFGWLDAIRYTSSEILDGVGQELRDRICAGSLTPAESIMVGQVFQIAPEVSSSEAFECFFSRFSAEETPLWTMLDAWNVSGAEPLAALERIKATAADPRTRRRFAPVDPAREAESAP
jgi:hypothetical protein